MWVPATWTQMFSGDKEPCTAFVSWALAKGGMPKAPDWFPFIDDNTTEHATFLYMSSNNPVPAWYAANNFVTRFVGLGWVSQRQIYSGSTTGVSVGDVIYYQWDGTSSHPHLAIVTSIVNGQIKVTDQGGATLYKESINRPLMISRTGADLRTTYPSMKVFVLHWQ